MADRFPLIANSSSNQIQEVPAGDRLDLTGTDLINVNTAGVVTATQGFSGNIIGVAATFSGDMSVGGTLTYEDVTNVDSTGLVTARSGVNIGNPVSVAATLASDGSAVFSGIVTATGGFNLGISSAGSVITSGPVKTLNFVGLGNTFAVNGTTVDISIQGGGGGGGTSLDITSSLFI